MEVYHRISKVTLLFVAFLLFLSCNNRSGHSAFRADNNIGFDTINRVARHHLDGDTANPYCNIEINFVYPIGSKSNQEILQQFFIRNTLGIPYDTLAPQDAVNAYVQDYFDNYSADAKTYRESVDEFQVFNSLIPGIDTHDSEHYADDLFYSYYERLSDSIVFNQYGALVFQVKQSNNKGGAASYDSFRNYVVDLQTGKQVTENDIFVAGYEVVLQQLIINSLLDQANVKSVEELEDLGFFGVREIIPNHNFLLTDKGIIYTYNKGEYSAYQLDAPQVFIPYEAILSLLKENSIVIKLAQ